MTDQTPEARLAAALTPYLGLQQREIQMVVASALDNTPTIAADLNDAPRLRAAARMVLRMIDNSFDAPNLLTSIHRELAAALTEGSGE